jgi:hypothetical protein
MARYDSGLITINGAGGVQELIPAVIVPEIQITAAREEVFLPLARRIDLTGPGDDFTIPQGGALTWTAYTGGDLPAEQAFNTAARTVTPTLRQLDVTIPIDVLQATQMSIQEGVIREAGLGLAASRDAGFAALYTEAPASTPDHEIGAASTALSFLSLRQGINLLYVQEAPRRFAWVVYPTQWAGELLLDDTLINASVKGSPVLTQGVGANGYVTSVLDVDIYISPQVVLSTTYRSMMFSKNAALGYGFKRLRHPVTGQEQEVLMDIDWNSARRLVEMNMTYHADFEGLKGSSTTTNNWLVEIVSS